MNIAVTGGMGSGKSRVSVELAKHLNAKMLSADHICRDLLQPGCNGLVALQQVAPEICFSKDGMLNRPLLRQAIFADKLLRKQVDSVIHPLVRKEIHLYCELAEANGTTMVVEIPLLFETAWQGDFDCTLLVYASDEVCVERIIQRDLVDEKAACLSIRAQIPIQEKIQLADFLVDNSGSFAETLDQIEYLVEKGCFLEKTNMTMNNT